MNNRRRIYLNETYKNLSMLRDIVERLKEQEETACDNMSKGLQGLECYGKAKNAIYNLKEALNSMDDALEYIECAVE